jgi:hypothetical protein
LDANGLPDFSTYDFADVASIHPELGSEAVSALTGRSPRSDFSNLTGGEFSRTRIFACGYTTFTERVIEVISCRPKE